MDQLVEEHRQTPGRTRAELAADERRLEPAGVRTRKRPAGVGTGGSHGPKGSLHLPGCCAGEPFMLDPGAVVSCSVSEADLSGVDGGSSGGDSRPQSFIIRVGGLGCPQRPGARTCSSSWLASVRLPSCELDRSCATIKLRMGPPSPSRNASVRDLAGQLYQNAQSRSSAA